MRAKAVRHPSIVAGFILACATSVPSQVTNAYQVRGPVKTVRLEVAKVTEGNGQSVEGPRRLVQLSNFDEKRESIDQTVKNPDGSIKFKNAWKSTHDAEGRLIRREYYNANGVQTCLAIHVHDTSKLVTKATFYCNKVINHHESFFYDNEGNKVREIHTNADGSVRTSMVFVYEGGRLVQENYYHQLDGSLSQRNIFVYDPQGNQTEFATYDDKGDLRYRSVMTYSPDSKGKPVEQSIYGSGNTLVSKDTYTYEFDSFGNWIRRKVVREFFKKDPGVEVQVDYRTITYHPS